MSGKRLRDNGLWESSRMMLPQHKDAIRMHRRNSRKRERPELDEQRMEELQIAISDAMEIRQVVAVKTWDEFEDVTQVGVIVAVDSMQRRIKLAAEGEIVWIPLADVLEVGRP